LEEKMENYEAEGKKMVMHWNGESKSGWLVSVAHALHFWQELMSETLCLKERWF
jgi:hypothetical protein